MVWKDLPVIRGVFVGLSGNLLTGFKERGDIVMFCILTRSVLDEFFVCLYEAKGGDPTLRLLSYFNIIPKSSLK